jgi:hypothetical protein
MLFPAGSSVGWLGNPAIRHLSHPREWR